jgi:hypothetical protein
LLVGFFYEGWRRMGADASLSGSGLSSDTGVLGITWRLLSQGPTPAVLCHVSVGGRAALHASALLTCTRSYLLQPKLGLPAIHALDTARSLSRFVYKVFFFTALCNVSSLNLSGQGSRGQRPAPAPALRPCFGMRLTKY